MSEKAKCILAYIFGWLGGLIVLLTSKQGPRNTRFHGAQAIVIGAGYTIISMIYNFLPFSIPFFGTALWVIYIVAIVMGIVKANKEEYPELPVVGKAAQAIFGKLIDGTTQG